MNEDFQDHSAIGILPEELLEKIFSYTSQYRDYDNICLVCKKWNRIIDGLRKLNKSTFDECFQNGQIYFRCFENTHSPSHRHSHSSVVFNQTMYIFGGLSGTSTSYNDLWTLDLNTKIWSRPSTTGNYPSPKAAATLTPYKNNLILYGGYSHPYSYPFNQQVNFFDEFHIYDTITSFWTQKLFPHDSPKLAGHSASVIKNNILVLFAGCNASLGNKTNSIHCLNIETNEWIFVDKIIDGPKPDPRYGHSQFTLDDNRILVIGGCGGPNKQFVDVWILNFPTDDLNNCFWVPITVNNLINSPIQFYCIPFVQCEQKLITLGRPRASFSYQTLTEVESKNPLTIYNNQIEDRRCTCSSIDKIVEIKKEENIEEKPSEANLNLLNKSQRNTIKRLEALKKIANKFNQLKNEKEAKLNQMLSSTNTLNKTRTHCILHSKFMQIFVLDINALFKTNENLNVEWQFPIAHFSSHTPLETILYSLANGKDELILFGGMELESQISNLKPNYDGQQQHKVTNKTYIMKPKGLHITSN
ncbi:unnamed protein product [Brachionus calyciflorus]|uniref:F-box domain-containing protein n=1 Tax=Brachionus calyciflorus TaxID=104777 RepID=A0A814N8B0_9BILA|nr:unnamed protein product [Brachionus calyciflorus]